MGAPPDRAPGHDAPADRRGRGQGPSLRGAQPAGPVQDAGDGRGGPGLAHRRRSLDPADVLVVHRRCRRRRAVGRHRPRGSPHPRQRAAFGQRRARLPRPAARDGGRSLEGGGGRPRGHRRASSCTTPPAPRSSTPSSRWGSSPPGRPGSPPWPATPTSAGGACASTRAAVSWPAATPSAPPASARSPSSWPSCGATATGRQVHEPRLAAAVNTGGIMGGKDTALVAVHVLERT